MTVWRSPAQVPADLGRTVLTIGVFDGVHRGHQEVVRTAAARARDLGLPLVAVTFDPHPMVVVRPEIAPKVLTRPSRRAELLRAAGADHVLVLPFGRERSEQSPREFVEDVVVDLLHGRVVVVGKDFRFGHRAAGDVTLLAEIVAEQDLEVETIAPVGDGDVSRWSSTYVRDLLDEGQVAAAADVLGRPFRVGGVVVHGGHRGRELGFPTANIPIRDDEVVPADGVYAGWLIRLDGPAESRFPSAISIGTNPTFGESERRVEAYVLDDDLDLYGVAVAVEFVQRIRGMERFDSAEALVAQMADDVRLAREILRDDEQHPAAQP